MVINVKQVVPTPEQASALGDTLRACNTAASWLSERMYSDQVFRKFDVQKRLYTELRERFGLAAQPAIRVIGKTVDAYTTRRANLKAGNYGPPGADQRRKVEDTPPGSVRTRRSLSTPAVCPWHLGDASRGVRHAR